MAKLATCMSTICATAMTFAFGCATTPDDSPELSVEQASKGHTEIHPEDNCDPVTFGALCNPNFHGTTTLAAFQAELAANKQVAAWEYGGGDIRVNLDATVTLPLKMTVAGVAETVNVTASTPVVDTTSTTGGISVGQEIFDQLAVKRDVDSRNAAGSG